MAGNQDMRSSLAEGLEDISEEEQLKMALELSKNDIFGPSDDFGPKIQPSSNNMSVDSNHSGGGCGVEFDEWIRTPAEDRLQLLTGDGPANSESQSDQVQEISINEEAYISDDEDEDEILKNIIEQSKHALFLSEEEKTKIAMDQSKLETSAIVPMDVNDENEQLEAAIKLSLGATYERLMYPSPVRQSSSASSISSISPNSTLPKATQSSPSSSPPSFGARPRPSSLHTVSTAPLSPTHTTNSTTNPIHFLPTPSPPLSPTLRTIQPKQQPTSQSSPSIPCPSSARAQQHLNIATSPLPSSPSRKKSFSLAASPSRKTSYPLAASPSNSKTSLPLASSPSMLSQNSFFPLTASSSSPPRPNLTNFPLLTEDQQLEMALKISQEEAEDCKVINARKKMSEEDQMELAIRLSRSESACQVGGNPKQTSKQRRSSGLPHQSAANIPGLSIQRSGSSHQSFGNISGLPPLKSGSIYQSSGIIPSLPPQKSGSTQHLPVRQGGLPQQLVRPLAPSQSSPSLPIQFKQADPRHSSQGAVGGSQLPSHGDPRVIVVDGSNVGMAMGRNQQFRAQALSIVYAWFSSRGHEVVIFLPRSRWNKTRGKDRDLLDTLEKASILNFTPSRRTQSGCWDSYDDRYIVKYAAQYKGIIVTNDNYRDLVDESVEFRDQIENRLLPFIFVKEEFYPPDDPMGKNGPMLTEFLKH